MMKYNDAYSMMGAMINQAFADQHEKKAQARENAVFQSHIVERKSHKMQKCGLQIFSVIL